MNWQAAISKLDTQRQPYILVSIIGVDGSAPRDAGTKMVVTKFEIYGSIGGGNLEFTCIKKARELLTHENNSQAIEYYPLSAKFNQCCSGAVSVLFESFVSYPPKVVIFGAGHVAKELSVILPRLGYSVSIVDQRQVQIDEFSNQPVSLIYTDNPLEELNNIDSSSYLLVMTHDHELDFNLCSKALTDFDFAFLGLIGSQAKANKFKTRMEKNGLKSELIERLVSPIGLKSIPGKKPMEVAVSIAGQLISLLQVQQNTKVKQQGINLKDTLQLKEHIEKINNKIKSRHLE